MRARATAPAGGDARGPAPAGGDARGHAPAGGDARGPAPAGGAARGHAPAFREGTRLPTRRQALAGGAAALALVHARPATAAPPPDVEQLERLLALERRLESTYATALARDAIDPRLGETLLGHEREHVRGLVQVLRGRGRSPRATVPPPGLGAALTGRAAFGRFAIDLETETVRAYHEVLATLRDDGLCMPLGSIMASGSQHVVALRQAAGEDLLAPA